MICTELIYQDLFGRPLIELQLNHRICSVAQYRSSIWITNVDMLHSIRFASHNPFLSILPSPSGINRLQELCTELQSAQMRNTSNNVVQKQLKKPFVTIHNRKTVSSGLKSMCSSSFDVIRYSVVGFQTCCNSTKTHTHTRTHASIDNRNANILIVLRCRQVHTICKYNLAQIMPFG